MINCMVISLHMVLDLKKKKVKIFFGHRLVVQTIAVIETKTVSLLGSLAGSQRKQHLVCGAGSCQRARLRACGGMSTPGQRNSVQKRERLH